MKFQTIIILWVIFALRTVHLNQLENNLTYNDVSDFEIKNDIDNTTMVRAVELPRPLKLFEIRIFKENGKFSSNHSMPGPRKILFKKNYPKSKKPTMTDLALQLAAKEGIEAMTNLYEKIEPDILKNGQVLEENHPGSILSKFNKPSIENENIAKAAFATIVATKAFRNSYKQTLELGRQAETQKISFRRTALEGLCPPRETPICLPAAQRYRTHDGTCNNMRRPRWGSAQMPFNRFLPPEYGDGIDSIRGSVDGGALSSARFVSLLVHGAREGDAPVTLMLAQWGQLLDHDLTSTAQPRSINGSVPRCCGPNDFHPSCFPIKVPQDDPWLAPMKIRCLEFLRSAPAQRRDCILSWREQTNQVTSFLDASPVYSSNSRTSDNARVFRNGLLVFGRGNPLDDVCMRGAIGHQCIRAGDGRSAEQPGLLALHHVWVGEHNRIATELSNLNPHWSDEKIYQESRRILGSIFQHITYREFLPIVLGREVMKLFDLELLSTGYYTGYDPRVNPTVANSFSAAAFRFGHSLVQGSYMRCDRNHNFIDNNVTLHEEFQKGDIGTPGSLHRLLRGMSVQKCLKRDEFITAELTNHLFQTEGFPFGLDLAAINIQRGRDHGVAAYTSWREPCGLSPINDWEDLGNVVGPESAKRISHAYRSVHDIDLFVGGIAERPVLGGLVGPTFACIIAQQFSNIRKGDRFWYENSGFESSFTPAQLDSLRRVSLAQVLCRAVGGGTFQPHIFIPHDFNTNERIECGRGQLSPIDLLPWLEKDPFANKPITNNEQNDTPQDEFNPIDLPTLVEFPMPIKEKKDILSKFDNLTLLANVDFVPNGSTGFHQPKPSAIHNKLDLAQRPIGLVRPTKKPDVNTKLDIGQTNFNNKKTRPHKQRHEVTTRRTVIINNVAIELRSNSLKQTTNDTTFDSDKTKSNNTDLNKINNSTETKTLEPNLDRTVRDIEFPKTELELNKTETKHINDGKVGKTNNTIESRANTKLTKNKSLPTTTPKILETDNDNDDKLRQYNGQHDTPIYNRPQNLIIDSPDGTGQYEIEINIKQNNKKQGQNNNYLDFGNSNTNLNDNQNYIQGGTSNYDNNPNPHFDNFDSSSRPGFSDYNNNYPSTGSTPFSFHKPIYTTKPPFITDYGQPPRTKPPTVIYLHENDDRTTTRSPGFLQNILSLSSGSQINSNKNSYNTIRDSDNKPYSNRVGPITTSNNYISRPPSLNRPGVSASSSSITGNYNGVAHASSIASSSGQFGSIAGVASSNGGDSTFSFNIRPSPRPELDFPSTRPVATGRPTYGLLPNGRPPYINGDGLSIQQQFNRPTTNPSYGSAPPLHSFSNTASPIYVRPPVPTPIGTPTNSYYQNREDEIKNPFSRHPPSYYRRPGDSLIFPQKKNVDNIIGRSELELNSTFDYELTTFTPLSNNTRSDVDDYYYDEDLDDDGEPGHHTFDKDGYLRPQHMILDFIDSETETITDKTTNVDDNFVLPVLNGVYNNNTFTPKQVEITTTELNLHKDSKTPAIDPYTNIQPKQTKTEILAEEYDDLTMTIPTYKTVPKETGSARNTHKKPVILTSINVLTKPERPDNWILYESVNPKPLLPVSPEIVSEKFSVAEVPKPLTYFYGLKKRTTNQPTTKLTLNTTDATIDENTINKLKP